MKKQKLQKLIAVSAAIAGCWSGNAWAQTTLTDLETDGWTKVESIDEWKQVQVQDYYFIFVDASFQYLMANDVADGKPCYRNLANPLACNGQTWILEKSEGKGDYTFALKNWNDSLYMNSGPKGYNNYWGKNNDNANYTFTLSDGKYFLVSTTTNKWVGPWNDDGSVIGNGENVAANKDKAPGFFVYKMSREKYKTKQKALFAAATEKNPLDMTSHVINPDFNAEPKSVKNLNGWTVEGTRTQKQDNGFDGKPGFAEFGDRNADSWTASITQTIKDLPVGTYQIKAIAQASAENTSFTFKVNDKEVSLNCIGDEGGNVAADGSVVKNGEGIQGWQYLTIDCRITDTDGKMTITGSSSGTTTNTWSNIDHVTIDYLGLDLTDAPGILTAAVKKAQTLLAESKPRPAAAKEALQAIIKNNNPAEGYTTAGEYMAAIYAVNDACEKYNALVAPYAAYIAMRDDFIKANILNVKGVYNDKDGAVNKLDKAIKDADTAVEDATEISASAITEKTTSLRAAALDFIQTVTINKGQYFDITKLMANPGFDENNVDGWTVESGKQGARAQCIEFYKQTFNMYQTLEGLPKGSYTLNAKAFMRPGDPNPVYEDYKNGINNVSAKLYANSDESTIRNIMEYIQDEQLFANDHNLNNEGKFIPHTMEGAQVYFNKGYYETSVAALLVTDGKLKLGIKNETSPSRSWTIFDDFRLYYYGESELITENVNIAAGKYATRIFPFAPDFGEADVTVYSCGAVGENGTTLTLAKVTTPRANVPYILYSESGCETTVSGYNNPIGTEQTAGLLTGVLGESKQIKSGYVLQTQNGVQAFYAVSADDAITVPQYRAYLTLPAEETAEVNALRLILPDDNATAISEVVAEQATADVYSLSGVLVRKGVKASEALNGLQKGIYIVNGVKKAVK